MDYTTGDRSAYLPYDPTRDAFVARSPLRLLFVVTAQKRGGVGTEHRRGRRKRYRDLDAVAGDSVGPVLNHFRPTSVAGHDTVGGPVPADGVLPIPSLDAMGPDTPPEHRVRELVFPHAELVASPQVVWALGVASRRTWTVDGLVDTLADWFVTRRGEARGVRDDLAARSAELQRVGRELRWTREASARQAAAYELGMLDRERYRRERDQLRSSQSVPSSAGNIPHVPAPAHPHDPHAGYELDPRPSRDRPSGEDTTHVAMPTLADMDDELLRHRGYYPQTHYDSEARLPSNGTNL